MDEEEGKEDEDERNEEEEEDMDDMDELLTENGLMEGEDLDYFTRKRAQVKTSNHTLR